MSMFPDPEQLKAMGYTPIPQQDASGTLPSELWEKLTGPIHNKLSGMRGDLHDIRQECIRIERQHHEAIDRAERAEALLREHGIDLEGKDD